MKFKKIFYCLSVVFFLLLSGCTKDIKPGTYDAAEVGKVKKVIPGVIISKRPVNIQSKSAIAASTTSDASNDDNAVTNSRGFEYVIKLSSGAIISLVQTEDLHLKVKQHILVIYGTNTRVVADDGSEDY